MATSMGAGRSAGGAGRSSGGSGAGGGSESINLVCPTCGARYVLQKYVPGQHYGCQRCSASLLFSKFALVQELGRGGFGTVYKAWQVDLQRPVALKLLHSDSEEASERFIREARIAANLNHPNIAAIYDVGQHNGKLYIAMQFVDGMTSNKANLGLREGVEVIRDAALAVDYAHARSIIHRDIKPHNIMITNPEVSGTSEEQVRRRVYVLDFGLARNIGGAGGTLTVEGQLLGTPAYMSPEQADGSPDVGPHADIYSLGATLYALATKKAPFEANTPIQILRKVSEGNYPPPSQVNPEVDENLEGIIRKAMATDAKQRYPTAGKFAQEINTWLQGGLPDATPTLHISTSTARSTVKTSVAVKKGRGIAIAISIVLVLLVAAGVGAFVYLNPFNKGFVAIEVTAKKADGQDIEATVSVPGAARTWQTPARILSSDIPAGVTEFTVSAIRYKSVRVPDISFSKEKPYVYEAVLAAETTIAEILVVDSEPQNASVRILNVPGEWTTPCTLTDQQVPYGTHVVEFLLDGFEKKSETVSLIKGREALRVKVKLNPTTRKLAFTVTSNPTGARILLDNADTGKRTPAEFYRDEVPGDRGTVTLEYEGYQAKMQPVAFGDASSNLKIDLDPKMGSFLVTGAEPGAKMLVFVLPEKIRDGRAVVSLWSDNEESLGGALEKLSSEDAAYVTDRLQELSRRSNPRIADGARKLSAATPASPQVAAERMLQTDTFGNRVVDKAWVSRRYRILCTSSDATDFTSEELQPIDRQESTISARMTRLARIRAKMRPPLGHFEILFADGRAAGRLENDGKPMRSLPGRVTVRFVPPPSDPLLCGFEIPTDLSPGQDWELTGNLYYYAGTTFEIKNQGDVAVRAYTKVLEETGFPSSEREERAKLPDRISIVYEDWIVRQRRQPKTLGGNLKRRADEARAKPFEEAAPRLLEVYVARDADKDARVAAAGGLAWHHARAGRPYEAIEWIERVLEEKADPGPETENAVADAVRHRLGLEDRWDKVRSTLADMRKIPDKPKVAFLGVRAGEKPGVGLRVDALADNSPAERAGIRLGDVITEIAGRKVTKPGELESAVNVRRPDEIMALKVERLGNIEVRLGAVSDKITWTEAPLRIGTVNYTHASYGTFVMKDAGIIDPAKGDVLEFYRNGALQGELRVDRIAVPDETYRNGAVVCKSVKGSPAKGDEVRRKK